MKYLSLFSGIGGFELGIQQAYETNFSVRNGSPTTAETKTIQQGMEPTTEGNEHRGNIPNNISTGITGEILDTRPKCIGYSEIDKYAIQTYQQHFPEHKNYGDITKINAEELPDFDLLVGGFPCQAFSIAGKRKGFEDTRGTLFFEIARILKAKQPRLFLLENVKGLLSHDNGNTFRTIVSTLNELGYDLQWQVLNSKNHGVPQNRERVFIIGHLRGTSRPEVFPFGQNGSEVVECGVHTGTLTGRYPASQREGTYIEENGDRSGEIKQINQPKHSNDRVYGTDGLSPTLNTMQSGKRQPFIAPVLTPDRLEKRQNGRRFKENGEPSFTLTSQDRHGIYDGVKIRRLTPVECERLQGFPDGWTIGSDTQRYKQCGNAVTVNVIKDIMEKLWYPHH